MSAEEKSKQGAWIVGGCTIVAAAIALLPWLRPNDAPVVVLQEQPKSLSEPAASRPVPTESQAETLPIKGEPLRESSVPIRLAPERSAPMEPPELDHPKSLSPDAPRLFPSLSTVITASFRETLGSHYVEILVAAPDGAPERFPARSPGASRRFSAKGSIYEVQVVAIDWNQSKVDVIVRAVAGL